MTNSMIDALHLRQIGQQRIATTIGFVNFTYNLFRFEKLMRLNKAWNHYFIKKIQQNFCGTNKLHRFTHF